MAYKLRIGGELPASAREILSGQLSKAVDRLELMERLQRPAPEGGQEPDHGGQAHEAALALHDARRCLKKARALLRVLRDVLPRKVYRRERLLLRECARELSGLRDADALADTVSDLRERGGAGNVAPETFAGLQGALGERAHMIRAQQERSLEESLGGLRTVLARLDGWPVHSLTTEHLLAGLDRSYAAGRQASAAARRHGTVEDLHELRKRVKDRWYQERLIARVWPQLFQFETSEAHRLSDLLGEDHDLALLAGLIAEGALPLADPTLDLEGIGRLIAERRRELQADAHLLAARLYAERRRARRRRTARLVEIAVRRGPG